MHTQHHINCNINPIPHGRNRKWGNHPWQRPILQVRFWVTIELEISLPHLKCEPTSELYAPVAKGNRKRKCHGCGNKIKHATTEQNLMLYRIISLQEHCSSSSRTRGPCFLHLPIIHLGNFGTMR